MQYAILFVVLAELKNKIQVWCAVQMRPLIVRWWCVRSISKIESAPLLLNLRGLLQFLRYLSVIADMRLYMYQQELLQLLHVIDPIVLRGYVKRIPGSLPGIVHHHQQIKIQLSQQQQQRVSQLLLD